LGWDPDTLTILAVGSKRVDNLLQTLNVINHFGKPVQIVIATGKDCDLYEKIQNMQWHIPFHLYDFISNMPTLMHASDILICKAGGLIITEALACHLPMILIDIIQGQETGNARFVMDSGAGELAQNPGEVLEIMAHLTMESSRLLKTMAKNADLLSRPFAAYDTADILWNAAETGLEGGSKHPDPMETGNLINLLDKFQIQLQAKPTRHSKKNG
jgi:UDP-N-acetylglucosamine:LPS N-acetylglucosamine transferase